jgi:hypothetical protein
VRSVPLDHELLVGADFLDSVTLDDRYVIGPAHS